MAGSSFGSRISAAAEVASKCAMIDGAHHKQWVIDQMLRLMLGDGYAGWVAAMNADPEYTEWDVGIAP